MLPLVLFGALALVDAEAPTSASPIRSDAA